MASKGKGAARQPSTRTCRTSSPAKPHKRLRGSTPQFMQKWGRYLLSGREGETWPEVPGRISSKTLNKDAWMWMKLIMCNIMPTRHETTLGSHQVQRQLLPFPMFITKWAKEAGVATYSGDEIFNVPKAQQFFPYGIWKKYEEVERDPAPPAPTPPLAARTTRTNTPTFSHSSSSQPSRNELMRALRRNERIMRRHEQLLLMLHPNIDTS
ncbi:hypothetical protein PIB30_083066 [Stylosanthes scabra]|uniref:Uncharacterized protein n=1 Tax=Stylosanthes scabra TaxID=79078 RepID=A0ABU6YR80_9FABA|nr:hypothetical protein [Stylosanthes scabra]